MNGILSIFSKLFPFVLRLVEGLRRESSQQLLRRRYAAQTKKVSVDALAQRWKDFLAPEIDHFGNIGAEGNANGNLREFIMGRQRE
jgi:hypothetical protein